MFGFLKKKEKTPKDVIKAPVSGTAVKSAEIPDPTFSEEMLGKGLAIRPSEGKLYAPCDGTVTMVFRTKHAIGLTSDKGTEVLIHVGLDTVSLNGEPFIAHVNTGDKVSTGDLMLEFDLKKIEEAGLNTIIPIIITNSGEFQDISRTTGNVAAGDVLIKLN